jgi:hypothetical protein
MTGLLRVALVAAVLAVAIAIVIDDTRPPADADNQAPARSASTSAPAVTAAATTRSTVAGQLLVPADRHKRLITVPVLGRFSVRCGARTRLGGVFTSTANEGMWVTVEPSEGQPRSALVEPGKRFAFPPSHGSTTTQRWQFARINEAFSSVALVFVSSSPAYPHLPACAISAYAFGPTRQPRPK